MKNLKHLTPFKYFALTNFPYIEADFDALTNYELFCKIVEYVNNISSVQNDVTDNFNELLSDWNEYAEALSDEWNETKNYIDNYFDNLNVQDEINNKIDEMATEGYFDDLFERVFKADILTLTADTVSDWIDDNLSQETGYIIDKSLTVENAGADAKITGYGVNPLLLNSLEEIQLGYTLATGYITETGTVEAYANVYTSDYTLNGELIFWLSSRDYFGAVRCAFYDSSDNFISAVKTGNATDYHTKTPIIVPENASKLVVQRIGLTNPTILYTHNVDKMLTLLKEGVDSTTNPSGTEETLTFIDANGYYTASGSFETYSRVTTATIDVNTGEQYAINTRNYYSLAIVVFFDSSNNFISGIHLANNQNPVHNLVVTVPANASKMMIQRYSAYPNTSVYLVTGVTSKTVLSDLYDKYITVIGDSVTEKNYRAKTNWSMYIRNWCDAVIQNLGLGGTGFMAGKDSSINYKTRISQISDVADIIGVAMSFNDIADESVSLGTVTDTLASNTVAGYTNDFFDTLLNTYPNKPIICYVQNPWSTFHYGVERSDTWIDLLTQICNRHGIPFYKDLYFGGTLKPWISSNRTEYFTSDDTDGGVIGDTDGLHPNSKGHKIIARYLYTKFADNVIDEGLNYKL